MLCNAYGKPIDELKTVPWGTNCAISTIVADDGWVEVVSENDTEHLKDIQ